MLRVSPTLLFSQRGSGVAYDAHDRGDGRMTIIRDEKYRTRYERGRVKVIESLLPKGAGQPALDLGCGSGYFSRMLTERGWVVTAVDAEPENVVAAECFVHRGIVGILSGALNSLESERFGFVMALELIKHPSSSGI
jgi:2-polyprenyl-3-methyl-5-hydroxy-6-metoxy-1,4-benzoquinol methylase